MNIERRREYMFGDSLERIDLMLDGYVRDEQCEDEIKKAKECLSMKTGALVSGTVMIIEFYAEGDVSLIRKLKVLRAFSSEVIAMLSGNDACEDIFTYGNIIMAVYDTPLKSKIESAVRDAAAVCSLSDVINRKANASGYPPLKVSTGLDFGDMLMMRFCEYDGTRDGEKRQGCGEVQYIGPVTDRAEMLCHRGFEAVKPRIYVSDKVFNNLRLEYQKFFHALDDKRTSFSSQMFNIQMNNWLCKH